MKSFRDAPLSVGGRRVTSGSSVTSKSTRIVAESGPDALNVSGLGLRVKYCDGDHVRVKLSVGAALSEISTGSSTAGSWQKFCWPGLTVTAPRDCTTPGKSVSETTFSRMAGVVLFGPLLTGLYCVVTTSSGPGRLAR